jgi:hypothetical protein
VAQRQTRRQLTGAPSSKTVRPRRSPPCERTCGTPGRCPNHPDQVTPVHSERPHAGSYGLRRADTIRQIAATMTVRSDGPDRRGSSGERSSGSFARAPCLPASDRRAPSESRDVAVSRTKRSRSEAAAAVASHGEAGAMVPTHPPLVAIRPSRLAVARSTGVASRSANCIDSRARSCIAVPREFHGAAAEIVAAPLDGRAFSPPRLRLSSRRRGMSSWSVLTRRREPSCRSRCQTPGRQ